MQSEFRKSERIILRIPAISFAFGWNIAATPVAERSKDHPQQRAFLC
jgi:hypothetical protein